MTFAQKIKEKKYSWGGRAFAARFASGGLVSISGSIRMGNRSTEDDELAGVHAAMLLEGTEQLSKKDIQIELDAMGANLSFSATNDRLAFSARVRSVHMESLLALIAEILSHPTFPQQELSILKQREEANLAMQAQDTRAQADIALSRLLYKKDHPHYAQTTPQSLQALKGVSQNALRGYHARLNRSSLVFSAAGDVTAAVLFSLVEKYFMPLPEGKLAKWKPMRAPLPRAQRTTITLPQKSSIDYMVGSATRITKDHADYPALMIGMNVLGIPGFAGRLMQIVREKEGLTYGVYSYAQGFEPHTDGYIYAWGTFSPLLFQKGRASILREIKTLVEKGVSNEEAKKHTKLFAARMKVGMSNSMSFARAAHMIGVEGKPLSYLDTFSLRVLQLSAKEINKALKKYLVAAKLSETAAGPIDKFKY